MKIPERPLSVSSLDLMKQLHSYAYGHSSWLSSPLGDREKNACLQLHSNLLQFTEKALHPILDRVTSREMQSFTMHDTGHSLKVAHLMWHIIKPERRAVLSPAEIALLVLSAHLHDLGMGLSEDERKSRLEPTSDLWEKYGEDLEFKHRLESLRKTALNATESHIRAEALFQLQQAHEALLCIDTRARHATKERYLALLQQLRSFHEKDPIGMPDISAALSFDGDSFEEKLIEICISHNEEADSLIKRDPRNFDQLRLPKQYPVGCCQADTQLVAAALRLADVLDFDRERTPSVLFHYLLPSSTNPEDNFSVREWSKHLSISNWEVDDNRIVFRGRSPSAFIHHAVTQFCSDIEGEIIKTNSVFLPDEWPFLLPSRVSAEIEASGYRYIPLRFSLDENRIYSLLMGRQLYGNRLVALREIIQNSVDACSLRDALTTIYDPSVTPTNNGRITIRYYETSDSDVAELSISDLGTGMDRYILENFFLKVGRSYYNSSEFMRTRAILRNKKLDFRPVSEFGVGFLSIFMLGNHVEIKTANRFSTDVACRTLRINGLGRLIELSENPNIDSPRFHGTDISVKLGKVSNNDKPLKWQDIVDYIHSVCVNIRYPLHIERFLDNNLMERTVIEPQGLRCPVPNHLIDAAFHIPVNVLENGITGEIVIFRRSKSQQAKAALAAISPVLAERESKYSRGDNLLLRGGFVIGSVPGVPHSYSEDSALARIEISQDVDNQRALPATNISRSSLVKDREVSAIIFRSWLEHLIAHTEDIERDPIGTIETSSLLVREATWLEKFSAFEIYRLAKALWKTAFQDFSEAEKDIEAWENGSLSNIWGMRAYDDQLHWHLFSVVLPSVTSMARAEHGEYYLLSPKKNFISQLKEDRKFMHNNWPKFVPYLGSISDLLWDEYTGSPYFNIEYKDRLSSFTDDELFSLTRVLSESIEARRENRPASMSTERLELLKRLADIAGDLKLGYQSERYLIRELC
jgi:hypothetical protein